MKKIIALLSFVLMLCVLFASCSEIDRFPSYSKNFDKDFCESFFDDYYLADAGLAYYKASLEVKIQHKTRENIDILLGTINNSYQNQFVSVVYDAKFTIAPVGNESGHLYIYQHKNAPNPMSDWQIESVSLIVLDSDLQAITNPGTAAYPYSFVNYSESYMDILISSSREIKTFKSIHESDLEIIKVIKNAYLSAIRDTKQETVHHYSIDEPSKYYYLLVKFKENSNIVWYTPLIISYDGFRICHTFDNYDEYISYGESSRYTNANETATFSFEGLETHYGVLSEEITNELYELLIADGWDPNRNNPAPPTTLPEPQTSSNVVPDSEVIPSDPKLPAVTTPPGR